VLHPARCGLDDNRRWLAEHTNAERRQGGLSEVIRGADVFIGLSAPKILTEGDLAVMSADAIVFALANPVPEVAPDVACRNAAVVATGRSDLLNQVNNALAFPGLFRGLLDTGATKVTPQVCLAAAAALAEVARADGLNARNIVPSVFDPRVVPAVAAAVAATPHAIQPGAATPSVGLTAAGTSAG
jgi:malate dehydrogenase (oxaloacetate-decarboxylating)